MNNKILDYYFFILFSLIPVSIILGSTISLITILLIDFSFIFFLLYKKEYKFLSNRTVKLILLLSLYLIFNSIISKNFYMGASRNFGFIRFGILFCAFNYFFYYKDFFNKIFIVWFLTLFILVIDVYIESFTGRNILGYGELYGNRIVSFFKDEPIAGGYINSFYLIIIGYLFSLNIKSSVNYKYLILMMTLFFMLAVLLTGERSSLIRTVLGFLIFYSINNSFKIKEKLISMFLLFLIIGSLINNVDFLESRYKDQFLKPIVFLYETKFNKTDNEKNLVKKPMRRSEYYYLYRSAFVIFKTYPYFGVGNKNFRVETCEVGGNPIYLCGSHPHQIYFELLSEHGFLGTAMILFILFNLIFGKLKIIIESKNYTQIGCFAFLLSSLIPFLPSGAFFSDGVSTVFWINLSLMYSINKRTNIFLKN